MAPEVMYLVAEASLVARVALVAHLRHELGIVLGLLRQHACFVDRPAQGLLDVDVLAGIHGRDRDRRVHVIGGGDDDRVDVLLLLEHLAIVAILLDLRQLDVDEPGQVLGGVGARTLLVRGQLSRGRFTARAGARTRRRRCRRRCGRGLFLPLLDAGIEQAVVDVAEGDDVLAEDGGGVAGAHAADADRRDVHGVARRLEAAPKHVPRHDDQPRPRGRRPGHKIAPRHAC